MTQPLKSRHSRKNFVFPNGKTAAWKRNDLVMLLMCSEIPSLTQLSCVQNKLPAWKRNGLAAVLRSLWSLDISLDQALDTVLNSHKV